MIGRLLRAYGVIFLTLQACGGFEIELEDPRLGERGRVRFSGGGCSSGNSTSLAVGSTQVLRLEPQQDSALPADLRVSSSAPSVIDARWGLAVDEVILKARAAGEAYVELHSAGALYDRLQFRAEPAASVEFEAPGSVFEGGTYYVRITDVYGSCGVNCPLLGESFVDWSTTPVMRLALQGDSNGVATFLAGSPGDIRLEGREPSAGGLLIDQAVRIVPIADAGSLAARVAIIFPNRTVTDPQPTPVEIPTGNLFIVALEAEAAGMMVPIASVDVVWTVEGDTAAIQSWGGYPADSPEGVVFAALEPGNVTLVADVPLLDRTGRFAVTVVAAP